MLESRWIAAPLSALIWAGYVAIVILWTPLIVLFRLATFLWDRDRYLVGRLFHASAALAGRINVFWKLRIFDDVHPDSRKPYVFVANHSSFTDVFLVTLLAGERKFLSKSSVFHIPLLGWQMRIAGDVPIVRGQKESARDAMRQMRERLDRRISVILFPEGTRSPDGSLAEFREGAFRLAIEAGVDVLPLAITGAAGGLPKHSFVFRPTAAALVVLPAVSTSGLTAADAPRLAGEVRRGIAGAIEERAVSSP